MSTWSTYPSGARSQTTPAASSAAMSSLIHDDVLPMPLAVAVVGGGLAQRQQLLVERLQLGIGADQPVAEALGQRHEELDAEARAALDEVEQLGLEEAPEYRLPRGRGRGRARRLVQERDLAEEVAVGERGQQPARRLQRDGHRAVLDHVHPHAGLALPEDDLAWGVLAPVEDLLERRQHARVERGEDGHPLQERLEAALGGPAEDVAP